MTDDSAAHVSEEVTGAARAAPIAIMVAVAGTQLLGWLIYIAASFATTSVPDLLVPTLPLPMGQLFLNIIGKRGMLALWSCIIVVQVGETSTLRLVHCVHNPQFATGAAQGVDASRVVFAFARDNALPGSRWWKQINPRTQTPVNAVWLVMFCAAVCGLFGFSTAALSSLAG
jgi:amino acid transporter